jgi:hypothetical protein
MRTRESLLAVLVEQRGREAQGMALQRGSSGRGRGWRGAEGGPRQPSAGAAGPLGESGRGPAPAHASANKITSCCWVMLASEQGRS